MSKTALPTVAANAALRGVPEDLDCALAHAIGDYVGRSRDYELTGARHPTDASPLWKLGQRPDRVQNAMRDDFGAAGCVLAM